jgi:hypothetical protein
MILDFDNHGFFCVDHKYIYIYNFSAELVLGDRVTEDFSGA